VCCSRRGVRLRYVCGRERPGLACECCLVTHELVRAMAYRMHGALVASLSVAALILSASATFGQSGGARGGRSASTPPTSHMSAARSLRHHRGNRDFFPAVEDFSDGYGPSYAEPLAGATQPVSGDIHYSYTYDVPWDWAHRYPPNVIAVTASERTYVPSCPAETVTVRGSGGKEQTVNIMRCY
jgi:hypothetical protein